MPLASHSSVVCQLLVIGFCGLVLLSVISDDHGQGYQEISASMAHLNDETPSWINASWALTPTQASGLDCLWKALLPWNVLSEYRRSAMEFRRARHDWHRLLATCH